MNYEKLYTELYSNGYHEGDKNGGVGHIDMITTNYDFDSILDVGCSQGMCVKKFQEAGKKAHGVDVSKIAIQHSKEMGIKNCVHGSALDIPHPDDCFDAIVSTDVLEHLIEKDVPKAISEICRVSKKYLFLKISTKVEGQKKWLRHLHSKGKYEAVDNLHLTVQKHAWWIKKIEQYGKFIFKSKEGKTLIFERKNDSKS